VNVSVSYRRNDSDSVTARGNVSSECEETDMGGKRKNPTPKKHPGGGVGYTPAHRWTEKIEE